MRRHTRRHTFTDRSGSGHGRSVRAMVSLVLLATSTGTGVVTLASPIPSGAATPVCVAAQVPVPAAIHGVVPDRPASGCAPGSATYPATAAAVTNPRAAHAADDVIGASSYEGGSPPLLYGGGPLVGSTATSGQVTLHAVFWAPGGYAYPAGYASGVDTFLTDVAHDSGSAGNVFAVASQYTDGTRPGTPHLTYDVQVGAPLTVTDAYPTRGGCTADSTHAEGYTACVTDTQMHTELSAVLSADHLTSNLSNIFLLIFPPKVESCLSNSDGTAGGECSDTAYAGFCGYHSGFGSSQSPVLYADLPYPTSYSYTCLSSEAPNGSPALDSVVSVMSHEQNETVTDPYGTGWIDTSGNEEGDECAWNFGSALGGAAGARYNQVINGHHYYLQQEFSNEDYAMDPSAGCALTQDLPTASVAVGPAHPVTGTTTSFDGSASSVANVAHGIDSWSWSFGDGSSVATGSTTGHVYASPGTYTVILTVTDTDGFTASTSQAVQVSAPAVPAAPSFTAASPPTSATAGSVYQYAFASSGYPAPEFALVGAPSWVTIDPTSGTVHGTPPAGTTSFSYSVTATNGISPSASTGTFTVAVTAAPAAPQHGYWLVGSDGGIFSFGSAGFFGSTGSLALQRPVVGISPTSDRQGYWLVATDGGVFAFGNAGFHGSLPGLGFAPAGDHSGRPALAAPIVAMVPSATDGGYFMVASDGGVFAFGDARFAGSCPGIGGCSGTAVAVMPDATGNGYWLVTTSGAVYAFGDAPFLGAPAPDPAAVTSAVRTPDGHGYWILRADGTVDAFGDAADDGGPTGALGHDTATAVFATADGAGYWVATADGAVDNYGDAPSDGSMAGARLNAPVIAASGW